MLKDIIAFQKLLLHTKMEIVINNTALFFLGFVMAVIFGNAIGILVLGILIYIIDGMLHRDEITKLLPVSRRFYVWNMFLFGILILLMLYVGLLLVFTLFVGSIAGIAFLSGNLDMGASFLASSSQGNEWPQILAELFLFLSAYLSAVTMVFIFQKPWNRWIGVAVALGTAYLLKIMYVDATHAHVWVLIGCFFLLIASLILCPMICIHRTYAGIQER